MQSRTGLLRLIFAVTAIVASAFAGVSYVAHGIAYSDVLGAPGMNGVAAAELRRAHVALILALSLQLAAVALAAPLFENATTPLLFGPISEEKSRASICFRYVAVFVIDFIVTLVVAAVIIQALRYLHF